MREAGVVGATRRMNASGPAAMRASSAGSAPTGRSVTSTPCAPALAARSSATAPAESNGLRYVKSTTGTVSFARRMRSSVPSNVTP